MRNLKKEFDGFLLNKSDALTYAKRVLKKYNDATLLLSFYNGTDLFIKNSDGVHVSTQEEWKKYFEKQKNN